MNEEQVIEVLKFMGFKKVLSLFKIIHLDKVRFLRVTGSFLIFRNFRGRFRYHIEYSSLSPESLTTLLEEFLDIEREK